MELISVIACLVLSCLAMCNCHVHIMSPHNRTLSVHANSQIVIECESFSDIEIVWTFNHNPIEQGSRHAITNEHVEHKDDHHDHDDHDKHEHGEDHHHDHDDHHDNHDHSAEGHEHDHSMEGHGHDHDHDDHQKTGEHANHHRLSTLTITAATESDAGTYACHEKTDETAVDEIDVSVNGKWGTERVHIHHEGDRAALGKTIHLECSYFGKAEKTVQWLHFSEEIITPANQRAKISQNTMPYGKKSILHVDNAKLTDAGNYTCKVDSHTDTMTLTVALITHASGATTFSGIATFLTLLPLTLIAYLL